MQLIPIIFIILNIYGFLIMYLDKQRAKKDEWRISEKHIWLISILGGALGTTLGYEKPSICT
ncbi:DUF1294 domain-containing protein [Fredinandcohnia humi]